MIFQHTLDAVLSGKKSQTRRIVKSNQFYEPRDEYEEDHGGSIICVVCMPGVFTWLNDASGRSRATYVVGQTLSVQPGRGQKSVACIRITDVRREDVRNISSADVKAEGFLNEYPPNAYFEFLKTWVGMHDPSFHFWFDSHIVDYMWHVGRITKKTGLIIGGWDELKAYIQQRPAPLYDAWAITFELMEDQA